MVKVMQTLKRKIQNWLLNYLFCTVVAEDIASVLTDEKKKVQIIKLGKQQIADEEWRNLAAETKAFENFRIYSILFNTLAEQAKLRMFEKALSDNDLMFGKAMLYTLDVMKQFLSSFKSYKPR